MRKNVKRKPRPSVPKWEWLNRDGCWFCKNRNACNSCKANKKLMKSLDKKKRKKERKVKKWNT